MLRRGVAACETFAVEAIERAAWRGLVPDLTKAATADHADFRAHVILALKMLGSPDDFTSELIEVLSAPSTEARMTAAIGARRFSLDRMRAPLLDRVRHDSAYLVRYHAAESLLELGDVYPPNLSDHPDVFAALSGKGGAAPTLGLLWTSPPSDAEASRFADAATRLDTMITDRLAAGPCGKSAPLTSVDLYVVRGTERALAFTVEDTIGPCQRTLAFVAFVRTRADVPPSYSMGVSGKDPLQAEIPALPRPLKVEYSRATKTLAIEGVSIDTTKSNVVVLARGASGLEIRDRRTANLLFERHGRPTPAGMSIIGSHPEIEADVRTLLERSPELRAALALDPPSP
jgi:hypothetical protein